MDDDAAQLRERVEQLEQIAAKQQETIEELENQSLLGSWGRRSVLGSIAAALGIASASGSAAAGVGQVGTASERLDAVLDTLDANSATVSGTTTTEALEADAVDYSGVTADYRIASLAGDEDSVTITSTSFTSVGNLYGNVDTSEIPDGMTLFGRFRAYVDQNLNSATVTVQPTAYSEKSDGFVDIPSLKVSTTNRFLVLDSGFVEITNTNLTNTILRSLSARAKVDSDSAEIRTNTTTLEFVGVKQ